MESLGFGRLKGLFLFERGVLLVKKHWVHSFLARLSEQRLCPEFRLSQQDIALVKQEIDPNSIWEILVARDRIRGPWAAERAALVTHSGGAWIGENSVENLLNRASPRPDSKGACLAFAAINDRVATVEALLLEGLYLLSGWGGAVPSRFVWVYSEGPLCIPQQETGFATIAAHLSKCARWWVKASNVKPRDKSAAKRSNAKREHFRRVDAFDAIWSATANGVEGLSWSFVEAVLWCALLVDEMPQLPAIYFSGPVVDGRRQSISVAQILRVLHPFALIHELGFSVGPITDDAAFIIHTPRWAERTIEEGRTQVYSESVAMDDAVRGTGMSESARQVLHIRKQKMLAECA